MYYQIVSNHEIQSRVAAHVFKKCGLYINDFEDENDYFFYTFNHWFEDYYRPFINNLNPITLDESFENELRSFIKNENWSGKVSANISDNLISNYIGKYMTDGTLVVVDYPLEDLNDDLINEITVEEYNTLENLKQSFINNCKNWNVVRIDYKKFINEDKYFEETLQSLNLNSNIDIKTIHPHYYMLQLLKIFNQK
jgi:hypothetical protein